MKKFFITVVCIAFLVSCNDEVDLSGRSAVHEFRTENFSGVGVQDGFNLFLSNETDDGPIIKIEADENIIPHVKHIIKDGTLYFYQDTEAEFPNNALVKISVIKDSVTTLVASSANLYIIDTLRSESVDMHISNALLEGKVNSGNLSGVINGSLVELTGETDTLLMNVFNSSIVSSLGLESLQTTINISGGSLAEINVKEELEVKASQSSKISYRGNPIIRSMRLDDESQLNKVN